jgi:predicted nucleic acid-binding Zn ribbon protein
MAVPFPTKIKEHHRKTFFLASFPMGLQPVDRVLKHLMSSAAWQHQKRFQQIAELWPTLIPPKSLAHSRPIHITDNILWIATSSTTWSQHLNLQRRQLLQQLNQELPETLTDLRFSAVHWRYKPAYSPLAEEPDSLHPSLTNPLAPATNSEPKKTAIAAVSRWLERQQNRLQQLPLCPQCQVPTPQGELDRWQMCSCCTAQKWHKTISQNK